MAAGVQDRRGLAWTVAFPADIMVAMAGLLLWGGRDLFYVGLLIAVVVLGRAFYHWLEPRFRARFPTRWGEPRPTPEQEKVGFTLLILGIAIAVLLLLFQKACPFPRIE
jgi:hypothetical protein